MDEEYYVIFAFSNNLWIKTYLKCAVFWILQSWSKIWRICKSIVSEILSNSQMCLIPYKHFDPLSQEGNSLEWSNYQHLKPLPNYFSYKDEGFFLFIRLFNSIYFFYQFLLLYQAWPTSKNYLANSKIESQPLLYNFFSPFHTIRKNKNAC